MNDHCLGEDIIHEEVRPPQPLLPTTMCFLFILPYGIAHQHVALFTVCDEQECLEFTSSFQVNTTPHQMPTPPHSKIHSNKLHSVPSSSTQLVGAVCIDSSVPVVGFSKQRGKFVHERIQLPLPAPLYLQKLHRQM